MDSLTVNLICQISLSACIRTDAKARMCMLLHYAIEFTSPPKVSVGDIVSLKTTYSKFQKF